MLTFIPPLLPTAVESPPDGDGWIHEIKQDGYRTLFARDGKMVRAYTRQGNDWSSRYLSITPAILELNCSSAMIDGEVIVQDEQGRADFAALQRDIHRNPENLVFIAFDLLELDGADLRSAPVEDRRRRLMDLVGKPSSVLAFSDAVVGNGAALFEAAKRMELEGVVSKKLGSRYVSGRSRTWVKAKAFVLDTFEVIGVARTPGEAPSAMLAKNGLYAGRAFINLPAPLREAFWSYVDSHSTQEAAVDADVRNATWMLPGLQAQVKHLSGSGKLRHASLRGISVQRKAGPR